MNRADIHRWREQWYVFATGILLIFTGGGMGLASWQAGEGYPTILFMLILGGLTVAGGVALCGLCVVSRES